MGNLIEAKAILENIKYAIEHPAEFGEDTFIMDIITDLINVVLIHQKLLEEIS